METVNCEILKFNTQLVEKHFKLLTQLHTWFFSLKYKMKSLLTFCSLEEVANWRSWKLRQVLLHFNCFCIVWLSRVTDSISKSVTCSTPFLRRRRNTWKHHISNSSKVRLCLNDCWIVDDANCRAIVSRAQVKGLSRLTCALQSHELS